MTQVNCAGTAIGDGGRKPRDSRNHAMRIEFFGKLRDALGDFTELAAVESETVGDLRRRLARGHPSAASELLGPRVRACVDDTVVGDDFVVDGHERVEFLPPLSGG